MAELGITSPPSSVSSGGTGVDISKLSLVRTGGNFAANTSLDINTPGAGWTSVGGPVYFSSATFVSQTQIYNNGILQLAGTSSSADNDVYFVAVSGTLAFEYDIENLDVIQVSNLSATSSG